MGQELSTHVDNTVAQLADFWPEYNFRAYDGNIRPEDEAEHVHVNISAISAVTADPSRGQENIDLEVTMQADIFWRFLDPDTHQVAHPLDIAATLLAWTKNRYVEGASTVLTPLGFTQVLDTRFDGEPNMTVQHYVVQWTVELSVDAQLDGHGPAPIPFGGPEVTPPLTELWINDERRV